MQIDVYLNILWEVRGYLAFRRDKLNGAVRDQERDLDDCVTFKMGSVGRFIIHFLLSDIFENLSYCGAVWQKRARARMRHRKGAS